MNTLPRLLLLIPGLWLLGAGLAPPDTAAAPPRPLAGRLAVVPAAPAQIAGTTARLSPTRPRTAPANVAVPADTCTTPAWYLVPVPDVGRLSGVAAIGKNDVWAVSNNILRNSPAFTGDVSSIIHWDGTAWQPVPHPPTGGYNGIAAAGPASVWAVGFYGAGQIVQH